MWNWLLSPSWLAITTSSLPAVWKACPTLLLLPAAKLVESAAGDSKLVDVMIKDGLWDAFNNYHMGITSENVAEKFGVTREDQDEVSARSQQRAIAAIKSGAFKDETFLVTIKTKKGETVFDTDEFPREGTTTEILAKLRPALNNKAARSRLATLPV